jgi:PAS domain S-box-containing protein
MTIESTHEDRIAQLKQEAAERERLVAALDESEKRYRTLVSQVKDYAIFAMDAEGRALTWNEGVEAVLGYSREEFIGSPIELAFLPEDVAAGVPRRELETARREGVANDDRWMRRKDGRPFFAVGRTTSQVDASGRCTGFSKVFRDETQRVVAESARNAEAARFRTLVQNLRDYAIFMLDASGRITEWTDGAALVSGFRAEEVLGRHFEMFYTPDDRAARLPHRELEEAALRGRVEREGWRVTQSRDRIWVNEIATAIHDSLGRVSGFTKISRDLTNRKRTEDLLREADRKKDEFLATLAHELRNPLAPLRHGLAIIRLGNAPSSPLGTTLEIMERQLTYLVRLVDDLLDVARISTGKVELRRGVVLLRGVLAASIEATHALVEAKEHELLLEPGSEELFVDGDFDRLTQVFANLISNATKYMEPRGSIRIILRREDRHAAIAINDSGIGIRASDLPRVFEMFAQIRSQGDRAQGGLGIGLSLVKNLVELHGGSVTAQSAGLGLGSEFIVRLPLANPATSNDVPSPERQSRGPGWRILVVDDNRDAAQSLATLLTLRGNDVWVAFDGLEAIEKVTAFAPEIVMMDLGMPKLDGIETAKRLRSLPQGKDLKIIALTGWGQRADRLRTQAAGFDLHLVKPAEVHDLERVLRELHERGGRAL